MTSKPKSLSILLILHWFACVLGTLIVVCCLLRCFLSVANALQDIYKFEHTGNFPYFLHFLSEYHFSGEVCTFLIVAGELLIYGVQYRSIAQQENPSWRSIWCFASIFVFHMLIWLHAHSIPTPEWPYEETADAVFRYKLFANITVSPSAAYITSYAMHLRRIKQNTGDGLQDRGRFA